MTAKTVNKYFRLITDTDHQSATRTIYHVGPRFLVDVVRCQAKDTNLMRAWVENGHIPEALPSYISINTHYLDEAGRWWCIYNITTKRDGARGVIDFDYLREATPENERELVAECIRLFCEGTGYPRS